MSRAYSEKGEVLTEEMMAKFRLKDTLVSRIEYFRKQRGLEKKEMRILDWGCGRGLTVYRLREWGYESYGAEISSQSLGNGRSLGRQRGLNVERILSLLDEAGRAQYPDGFFHFVMSDQVFEHIADVDQVAREIERITAAGGGGVHIYPAPRQLVEGHLKMPMVHWLPKNRLRRFLIHLFVLFGVEAKLPAHEGKGISERAAQFYDYSVKRTFYRGRAEVESSFRTAGLNAEYETINSHRVRHHRLLGRLARRPLLRPIIGWALHQFISVHLVVSKPSV